MKHRSPLITLAAVALAFAIMFIVNMTVSPPGNSSSGTASPSVAPATASAGNPSPTETAGAKTTVGWIVLEDGSQVGAQTTGASSTAAPELNPGNPQVTVDGKNLNAAPVNGDEGL